MPRRSGLARPGRVPSCLRAFKTLPLKGEAAPQSLEYLLRRYKGQFYRRRYPSLTIVDN